MTEVVRAGDLLARLRGLIELAHMPSLRMFTGQLYQAAALPSRVFEVEGDKE